MPELNTDVRYIRGIGEKRAKSLGKLGIHTLYDLIAYFPRAYEDRTKTVPISKVNIDETVCVRAMVASTPQLSRVRKGMELVKLRIVDETGAIDVTYFNQSYLRDQLLEGSAYVFYGKVTGSAHHLTMSNPLFEREDQQGVVTGRIVPIYRLTAGVSQRLLINAVSDGLEACGDILPDFIPDRVREKYALAHTAYAYTNIHFPADIAALELSRRRLIFEEFFVLISAMSLIRGQRTQKTGTALSQADVEEFYRKLPFEPTGAQRRAVSQAVDDMTSGRCMSRLVQGDVGSGKTLVAAACIWFAAQSGKQSALMAPTEILAEQHYNTMCSFFDGCGVRVALLTGAMTAKQKREVKAALALGEIDLLVGTHAIITGDVEYSSLALVITDEQHRFGVAQRAALSEKGESPHVMVMSATPIPRTLALIIYGDLEVSIIDELPPGRQTIDTFSLGEDMRLRINSFIRKLTGEGRQVFIVCPMVEENEELPPGVKSAEAHAKQLSEVTFPDLSIACVHGKLKARDKEAVMAAFVAGEYDVLVSTTVIEVGVDVPNAALMVVENADRFGLSQLHQLRGRVGRGEHKSYCVLFSDSNNPDTQARLKVLCKANDGFVISEEDLRLRGPGDFFGSRQHGLPEVRIADLCSDMDVMSSAQEAAHGVIDADPSLQLPENAALSARVKLLLEENGEVFS